MTPALKDETEKRLRKTLTLPDSDVEKLRIIGKGSVSMGVSRLVRRYGDLALKEVRERRLEMEEE